MRMCKRGSYRTALISLTFFITTLFLYASEAYSWYERRCEASQSCYAYGHIRKVDYDLETCVLTYYKDVALGCAVALYCNNNPNAGWFPANSDPGYTHYPKDEGGNSLPHFGGCNDSTEYYDCSMQFQDATDFSNQFPAMSKWWYFTSSGNDGRTYKCMSFYKNSSGTEIHYRTCDYHTIDPVTSSDCISEEAFNALDNTDCGQKKAFDTGIFVTYNSPDSAADCDSCIATGADKPEGSLGCPSGNARGQRSACASQGAPAWSVNVINMNIFMTDTPLWYEPTIGPEVQMQLSYNSLASNDPNSPFGSKWFFRYSSYVTEDSATGNVTVHMPDGKQDVFTPDGQTGYTKPVGVFSTLTRIAANNFTLQFLDGTAYQYNRPSVTITDKTLLTAVKDTYNQQLTISYIQDSDRFDKITDATGHDFTFVYNAGDDLVDQINDPFGRSALFQYTNGILTKITDMGGIWAEFTYDTDSLITSVKNEKGQWQFKIEPADEIENGKNPYPAPDHSMWKDYRITITDPLGKKEEYHYYGMNSWYISPKDYVEYASPDNNNYTNNKKTIYYLDRSFSKGGIRKIKSPEGIVVTYEYDTATGLTSAVIDGHGHKEQFTYNANGLAASITDAKNNVTTLEYYPNNIDVWKVKYNLQSTPEDDGIVLKTVTYNGNTHDVATITDRLNIETAFTYNSYGQVESATVRNNTDILRLTEMIYESVKHELNFIKRNSSIVSSFTYDNVSRVRTSTDDKEITLTYDYNNLDQVTKITYPDTKFEEFTYSVWSPRLIDSAKDRAGRVTSYTYDALKRLTKVQGKSGIIKYGYDANGNLTKLTDADGKATLFEFNSDNSLTKKKYANNTSVTYLYDEVGLLKDFINARDFTKTYNYDDNHNITKLSYLNEAPVMLDVNFTYDDYNRLDTMVDGIGTYDYEYDELNRLKSINHPWTLYDTVSFQYNELGDVKKLTAMVNSNPVNDQVIDYFYDYDTGYADADVGRLKEIKIGTSAYSYGYTGVNPLMHTLTRPNGSFTEYDYNTDLLKKLKRITNKTSTNDIIDQYIFTYNSRDLIGSEDITTETTLDAFTESHKTYAYNSVNQLVDVNNKYGYDADGNMTKGETPEGYQFTATYDAENRLKTFTYNNGTYNYETKYFYSGDGLLAKVEKWDNTTGPLTKKTETRYIRAGFLPVQERNGSNAVTREYTWGLNLGGGIGGLLSLRQGGEDYSYFYDGKGNVSALLKNNDQSIAVSYRYDVFGRPLKKTGTLDQPYRFSTKQYDEKTGLLMYEYRFNNLVLGKWMTRDPLGEQSDVNLYRMVGNNPVNWSDPFGLEYAELYAGYGAITGTSITAIGSIAIDVATGGLNVFATPAELATSSVIGSTIGYGIGYLIDQCYLTERTGDKNRKYQKPSNPNRRKGAEERQKGGDREKNVGHPKGEEHSRIPKGGFRRK